MSSPWPASCTCGECPPVSAEEFAITSEREVDFLRSGASNIPSMEQLCVFTPTYNRAHTLRALFESLKAQSSGDFYWLVVDDGSTDATADLVRTMQSESPFRIEYAKQPNGGKQRAHNRGVELCESELFVCVDSDDTLVPDAVAQILSTWLDCRDDARVAGVVGLCGRTAETPLGSVMPPHVSYSTLWDLYYVHGHKGDTVCAHRVDVLRRFPFKVASGEKFMAEPYVYHQIDQEYVLRLINRVLLVREYLPDGYTQNVRKVTKANPLGYMMLKRMYIGYSKTFRLKFVNSVLYLVGCRLSGTPHGVRSAPCPLIAALALLPAFVLTKTVYR